MRNILDLPENYGKGAVRQDVTAGITVLVMLIPQSMAYAMLAGLPPVMGLYASIIPLIIYALFGTSRYLAVGPVAMASILVFSGVSQLAEPMSGGYIEMVILLTLMVGGIQLVLGLLNAGALMKFVSKNVIAGFTSAVAIIIGLSQIGNLLGVDVSGQNQAAGLIAELGSRIQETHLMTAGLGAAALLILITGKKIKTRLPVPLLVVTGGIVFVSMLRLDQTGMEIVGEVPAGLPGLELPVFTFSAFQQLLPTALTIAFISMMESLAITKSLAKENEPPIDVNKELRAIGLSNAIGSLFSAYPVTGSFSRSAVNAGAGAVSKLAMLITAAGVVVTILFMTELFYFLPQSILAAIIIASVAGLVNFSSLSEAWKVKREDAWVWLTAFTATLVIGIQWGLLIGVVISLCLLIHRIAHPHIVEVGWNPASKTYRDLERFPGGLVISPFVLLRIDGRIHFSNMQYVENILLEKIPHEDKKVMILDMGGVNDIDTSGIEVIERVFYRMKEKGSDVYFASLKGPVRDSLRHSRMTQLYPEYFTMRSMDQVVQDKKPDIDYMI
ncbi:SulP family inorganic anion transporter [Alkalicoccus halolimnae]|uniref:Sulfate permease n=1 Tax=Alkalicoccus halolimnae TaxID=1667239 RepID=A0A5C7F605_9BACI|nr:sulfate permease [Alkalicoccus halolimnae]TXF84701.1 sulfate permease [Alkalicoccus halolimnae]